MVSAGSVEPADGGGRNAEAGRLVGLEGLLVVHLVEDVEGVGALGAAQGEEEGEQEGSSQEEGEFSAPGGLVRFFGWLVFHLFLV